jgi:hypothetical protein
MPCIRIVSIEDNVTLNDEETFFFLKKSHDEDFQEIKPSGKNLEPRDLLLLWSQVRAM